MKIGIILYSYTGNTLSVAQRIEEALKAAGHTVTIDRVEPESDKQNPGTPIKLKSAPDVSSYDAVIFASPVQAFSLAAVMKQYLSGISGLEGKKVYCFVTQQLKKGWMGGNRALKQIAAACKAKGAMATSGGIVHWSSPSREDQILEVVKKLGTI